MAKNQLLERFSKHRYDIKYKSDNELVKHFYDRDNVNISILQSNFKNTSREDFTMKSGYVY